MKTRISCGSSHPKRRSLTSCAPPPPSKYGSAAGSLPDIKSLLPVEVELGHSDSGWVDPASNPANDKQRLRIGDGNDAGNVSAQNVPTTYNEMFKFNSAVMGFGNSLWLGECWSASTTL